jgi:hypothetical protein
MSILLQSCFSDDLKSQVEDLTVDMECQKRIVSFEKEFIKNKKETFSDNQTRSSSAHEVLCIGYVTIAYHGNDSIFVNQLWSYYQDSIVSNGHFLTLDGKVRVYFPLRDAIITIGNNTYEADSCGRLFHDDENIVNLKVVARKQTNKSIYTRFKKPYTPESIYTSQNAVVFNLGERNLCCKNINLHRLLKTRSETNGGGVSCTKNHYPYPNCTVAFGCAQDRCVTQYNRCMDYNGFGTDCSGNTLYFVGSDCSVAMSRGHCWNEVMN